MGCQLCPKLADMKTLREKDGQLKHAQKANFDRRDDPQDLHCQAGALSVHLLGHQSHYQSLQRHHPLSMPRRTAAASGHFVCSIFFLLVSCFLSNGCLFRFFCFC